MPLTLGSIEFSDDELMYDNSARPLLLTSAPPPSNLINSYLRVEEGNVLTLFNPTVTFLPRSWTLSVYIPESKYVSVLDLILEQNDRQDEYRSTLNPSLLRGQNLVYLNLNLDVFVWIADISVDETELDVDTNEMKHKCTINLNESEVQ